MTKVRERTKAQPTSTAVAKIDPALFDRGRRIAIAVANHPESAAAVKKMTGGVGLSRGASFLNDKEVYLTAQFSHLADAEKIRAEIKKVNTDFVVATLGEVGEARPGKKKYEGQAHVKNALSDLMVTALDNAEVAGSNVILINSSFDADDWKAQALVDVLYWSGELLPEKKRQQWESSKVLVRFIGGTTEEPMIVDLFETQKPNDQSEDVVSTQDREGAIDVEQQGEHVVN